MPEGKKALVVVHLSSLDSYADIEFEASESRDTAYALSASLSDAVLKHDGPVIIVDQGWMFLDRDSRPRGQFIDEIGIDEIGGAYDTFQELAPLSVYEQHGPHRNIIWIKFDEQDAEWKDFLKTLDKILKAEGVASVRLAGLFYERDLSEGCVTTVYKHLRRKLPTEVAPDLVGCVSDFYGPEDELPGCYERGKA